MWHTHQTEILGASRRDWLCLISAEPEWIRRWSGSSQDCQEGWRTRLGYERRQETEGPGPWAQSCLRRSQWGALDTAVPVFSQPLDLSWARVSQWLNYVPSTGREFNTRPLKSDKCPLQCASVMLRAGWNSHLLALLRAPMWTRVLVHLDHVVGNFQGKRKP